MRERDMRPAVMEWLESQGHTPVCEVSVWTHTADIIAAKFAERIGRKVPPLESLIGVELKLSDIAGVLKQCKSLSRHVHQTYAAMPKKKVGAMIAKTLKKFVQSGIGLLSVGEVGVEVVIRPIVEQVVRDDRRDWMEKKLWRRIRSGNTFVTPTRPPETLTGG